MSSVWPEYSQHTSVMTQASQCQFKSWIQRIDAPVVREGSVTLTTCYERTSQNASSDIWGQTQASHLFNSPNNQQWITTTELYGAICTKVEAKRGLNWRLSALCLQLRKMRLQQSAFASFAPFDSGLLFDVRATTSPTRANSWERTRLKNTFRLESVVFAYKLRVKLPLWDQRKN